jgi:hypothetical protein
VRAVLVVGLVALSVPASGCGSPKPGPLASGTLESGMFWKNPMSAPSNEGSDYAKGSRVELFEPFVVVTTPDGLSHVHPHGYYSGLVFKKD